MALFLRGEGITQAATGPGRTRREQRFQDLDGLLQDGFEGVHGGTALAWLVWYLGDIEGDEMGEHLGRLRRVDRRDLARRVDGLLDRGVLAVQVGEWDIAMAERGRRNNVHVVQGSFVHVDVELFHSVVCLLSLVDR